jgi:hypothetical protein
VSDGYLAGYLAGQDAERERIIKLIEPEIAKHKEHGLEASADYLMHLIALINGQPFGNTEKLGENK